MARPDPHRVGLERSYALGRSGVALLVQLQWCGDVWSFVLSRSAKEHHGTTMQAQLMFLAWLTMISNLKLREEARRIGLLEGFQYAKTSATWKASFST